MTLKGKTLAYSLGIAAVGVAAGALLLEVAGFAPAAVAQTIPAALTHDIQLAQADIAANQPVAPATQLPGGANSLQEGYQDWQVICATAETGRQCAMIQQQSDERSNQRVLAVELTSQDGDAIEGTLVLPFGLNLANGAELQIDEQEPMDMLPFSTCIPAGCLVPLSLDEDILADLGSGKALSISLRSDDNQDLAFTVSLNGFSQALNRIRELN